MHFLEFCFVGEFGIAYDEGYSVVPIHQAVPLKTRDCHAVRPAAPSVGGRASATLWKTQHPLEEFTARQFLDYLRYEEHLVHEDDAYT